MDDATTLRRGKGSREKETETEKEEEDGDNDEAVQRERGRETVRFRERIAAGHRLIACLVWKSRDSLSLTLFLGVLCFALFERD